MKHNPKDSDCICVDCVKKIKELAIKYANKK